MSSFKAGKIDMASFDAFAKAGLSAAESYWELLGELAKFAISINPILKAFQDLQQHHSCDIPTACWLPRSLGEIRSVVCPGGIASVRVRVTNCQARASDIQVAFPTSESRAHIVPETATLSPMERKWFTASFLVPADACAGQQFDTLLWVLGCNAHYLRWIVEIAEYSSDSCHVIEVEDCQDHVHHWYDHFYCDRPCFHTSSKTRELLS